MENNSHKLFFFDYKEILIDEIALDGLEGIGINLLWKRVEKRIAVPVTEKMKTRFWNFILNCDAVSLYQLPEPVPDVEILDRFAIIDEESGELKEHSDYLDGPYVYNKIPNEYGSSIYYHSRTLICKDSLKNTPYEDVISVYGDTLVLVASIEARWHALAPHVPIIYLSQLTTVHYCILELIGKGRENGQMSLGKSNLLKIVKDPKLFFYNRNHLRKLDLIGILCVTQVIAHKGVKSLLLRLKRFHQPLMMSIPKTGKLRDVCNYLLEQPDFSQRTDIVIKKGLFDQSVVKRLQKTVNIFNFEERNVASESTSTKNKMRKLEVKRRFITLAPLSDESSQSEGETNEEPLKCQYKVGVNLMRQAYELFLSAGLKGYTQTEIAHLLGVEFYTARTICRIFKSKNIVREFMEDKGKQRIARYIAVNATGEMDIQYTEEKQRYLGYLVGKIKIENIPAPTVTEAQESDTEVPHKKIKIDDRIQNVIVDTKTIETQVTEIDVLDGLQNKSESFFCAKRSPTLRQLRFANGILKVTRDKQAISGYNPLSTLVSNEINEPPMDTKALKILVQKLVTDGQVKILKMKWPGNNLRYSVLICAPHVKSADPIIKAKYKEICMRAINNRKIIKMKTPPNLTHYAYPRYLRIQKLHEIIIKMVYFNDTDSSTTDLPEGFCSLVNIIPELTVEFAMGNISHTAVSQISDVKISEDIHNVKLRDTPDDVYRMFLLSSNLQNGIRFNLKILAMLGLIQLIKDLSQNKDNVNNISYVFYVNRNAKILDTTGMWPRSNVDKELLEKSYHFKTFSDVEDYWNDVYNISTNTTIVLSTRNRNSILPTTRLPNEVQLHDNGQCEGDGLGPCGFDSVFYMEIPRLWYTFYSRAKKIQRHFQKKVNIKLGKREKIKIKKKPKVVKRKTKTVLKPVVKPRSKMTRKREKSDTLPIWSKQEDKIIMLCKAAITIMSPVSQAGCLMLRNLVAKEILSMNDPKKNTGACHRRALLLESNSCLTYEKECILNELRHHENITCKYEGLLRKLRLQYLGNIPRLMTEARLPMMELIWMMSQLTKSKLFNKRVPCVAMDYEDFHKNYTLTPSSSNKVYSLYKTPAEFDPCIAAIKEAVILSVMASYKKELTHEIARKIYAVFKTHAEQNLRIAVEHLRRCGLISLKEKILCNQIHKYSIQEVIQSSYKISANYQRKWISRLNSEFIEDVTDSLNLKPSETDLKGSPHFNCIFFELHALDALDVVLVSAPMITGCLSSMNEEQLVTECELEMKYKLKAGTFGWRNKTNMKKLSDLYQDIEVEEALNSLTRPVVTSTIKPTSDKENMEELIISHLRSKKEAGCTLLELQEVTNYDMKTLTSKLAKLESENVIMRVGYFDNLIVLSEFSTPWTFHFDKEIAVIPTPWLTFDMNIRTDVFLKWAGVILNKVFENPGCSLSYLTNTCEFLSAKGAQDICQVLESFKCVTLKVMRTFEVDLFSEDETIPELEDFNEYEAVENILVFPVINSLTKYAWLQKKMLNLYIDKNT